MANVTAHATLMMNDGSLVDLETTVAEGTETELKTSTRYAVTAVSLGTFANGKTITSVILPVTCPNNVSYAYIARRGSIACLLPVAVDGQVMQPGGGVGFQLQAGDTVQVMASTAANRLFALFVVASDGTRAIFSGSPSGSGNTDLTHILSGQGLGQSLTGRRIVSHYATSIDGSKLSTGGVVYLNDKGLPTGACNATNPTNQQPVANNMGGTSVSLNDVARVTTNA